MKNPYKKLISQYPAYVSKETFRTVCHISKRVARYYLQSGLVPCIDSGKKTRNYTIAMKDIVNFLMDREANPEKYRPPRTEQAEHSRSEVDDPPNLAGYADRLRTYYTILFAQYPDLLTASEAGEICGYTKEVVYGWLQNKKVKFFLKCGAYRIPKECLITYMTSLEYRRRKQPSLKQMNYMGGFEKWEQEKS